jgi:hypothetical protein
MMMLNQSHTKDFVASWNEKYPNTNLRLDFIYDNRIYYARFSGVEPNFRQKVAEDLACELEESGEMGFLFVALSDSWYPIGPQARTILWN